MIHRRRRTRDRERLGTKTLALIFAWQVALLPGISAAHFDAPGPPPINVDVDALNVVLIDDQDDGVDGNAELLLAIMAGHTGHTGALESFSIDNMNFDAGATWTINGDVYDHDECSPRNAVSVATTLIELDNGSKAVVLTTLFSIGRVLVASALGGPVAVGIASVTGVAQFLMVALNGHDDLGATAALLPPNGTNSRASVGPRGSAIVNLRDTTAAIADTGQCGAPPPPPPPQTPNQRAGSIYQKLRDALAQVPLTEAEPGNPNAPSPAQMTDVRASLASWVIDNGELIAGSAIEEARGLNGVAGAITAFQAGQTLAGSGDYNGALLEWESAYAQGLTAWENNSPSVDTPLPFQAISSPRFFAVEPGSTHAFVTGIYGSQGPVTVQVQNAPSGAIVNINPADDPATPVYVTTMDLSATPPGRYMFQIDADDGSSMTSDTLEVVVAVPLAVPAMGWTSRTALAVVLALLCLASIHAARKRRLA